jgi:FMN phosphatase YigB (HAD superfamily)
VKRLSYDWAYRNNWVLCAGIREALAAASGAGIPLAVVSNTLSGAAHRDFLAKVGMSEIFGSQVYSDEAGVRKPNPQMIWNATDELGVPPETCWFVGDTPRRDILCARRADVAKAILMRSPRTDTSPGPWPTPDETIADGYELRDLLQKSL